MAVVELDPEYDAHDLVGPVIRTGNLAEAVIDAVEIDNPDSDVLVLDREDYVRIHTRGECRLTLESLQHTLGDRFNLAALEIDMPSFKGRMKTSVGEYVWFYENPDETD